MTPTILTIEKVIYKPDYKLELHFSDGKVNQIDFENFVMNYHAYPEYREIEKFKQFKIDQGNIVWGENWDMIFHLEDLYFNNLDRSKINNESLSQSINI